MLLHVIDSSTPDMMEQIDAVESVLKEIGADVPVLRVYNKIDVSGEAAKIIYAKPHMPERVYVSAHSGGDLNCYVRLFRNVSWANSSNLNWSSSLLMASYVHSFML